MEKERRFAVIREKKRKWEERKEETGTVGQYEREIKKIEHYEMWWNIWERRRGLRSTLEHSIEMRERQMRLSQWETDQKGGGKENTKGIGRVKEDERVERKGADSVEKYWEELENVLENIGMDDIWKEENEPKEEIYSEGGEEQERKKIRLEERMEIDKEERKPESMKKGRMDEKVIGVEKDTKQGPPSTEREKGGIEGGIREGGKKGNEKESVKNKGKGEKSKIKGKGKGMKDQSIMKFLTRDLTLKEKTGAPVGDNKSSWDNNTGCGGGVVVGNLEKNNTRLDTTSQNISKDKMGGEKGPFLREILVQQQHVVGQLTGRDTEICRSVGCASNTTTLERSTTECTDQQQSAGPALQTESHRQ